MCAVGFLPLLNEREKVFTVEGHQGSAFGRGKSQLLDIGQSEMSSCCVVRQSTPCAASVVQNTTGMFSSRYRFIPGG